MDKKATQSKEILKSIKVVSHVVEPSADQVKQGKGLGNDGGYTWVG